MKLSDIDKVRPLRSELSGLRKMMDDLSSYPRYDASLTVNGEGLELENGDAVRIVQAAIDKATATLSALGVEVDE